MLNRIDKIFRDLRKAKERALLIYITAGDPDLTTTKRLALELEKSGADIIELGIPFSDPLADGPTIQAASKRALKKKVNLKKIFRFVREIRNTSDIPLVFMTYYNPVLKYGLSNFVKDASVSGVDGFIIPDLPYEEASDIRRLAKRHRIASIFLAAPTSPISRLKAIAGASTGFIYYVTLTGVTGARKRLPSEVISKIKNIKSITRKPVCVGFGISSASQARSLCAFSDGVIVGSAVIKIIEKNLNNKPKLIKDVSKFTAKLARAIHNA